MTSPPNMATTPRSASKFWTRRGASEHRPARLGALGCASLISACLSTGVLLAEGPSGTASPARGAAELLADAPRPLPRPQPGGPLLPSLTPRSEASRMHWDFSSGLRFDTLPSGAA